MGQWADFRLSSPHALVSFPSSLLPPSLPSRVLLWGLGYLCVTPKQLELTYFQDRGHWSSGHTGAQSSLPHIHRWSLTGCWAGMCRGRTPSCGMAHSRAECRSAWAPCESPAARCWCKGCGGSHGSWCRSARGPGAGPQPRCSCRACLRRDTGSVGGLFVGDPQQFAPTPTLDPLSSSSKVADRVRVLEDNHRSSASRPVVLHLAARWNHLRSLENNWCLEPPPRPTSSGYLGSMGLGRREKRWVVLCFDLIFGRCSRQF